MSGRRRKFLAVPTALLLMVAACAGSEAGDPAAAAAAVGAGGPPEGPQPAPGDAPVPGAAPATGDAPATTGEGETTEGDATGTESPSRIDDPAETAPPLPPPVSSPPPVASTPAEGPEPSPPEGAAPLADPTDSAGPPRVSPDGAAGDPPETEGPETEGPETSPDAQEPAGAGTGADLEVRGALEFARCGQPYLCATLAVPADHDDPAGPVVDLAVGLLPAGDPSRRVGYLLANPGGPGGGMEGFLDFGAGLSSYLLERFDVVGWDPRGVGGSVPAGCAAEADALHLLDPTPDSAAERAALADAARAVAEACAAGLGEMVHLVGTVDTVGDMDAIRRALGVERISYVGYSYGTLLGLLYADAFGEHLRAMVLDGVSDPSLSPQEHALGQVVGFDRALEAMFAWCAGRQSCPVNGDPTEAYFELLAQVDETPLVAPEGRVVLGPARVVLAAALSTYSSSAWPVFFGALAAAVEGDGTGLGRLGEAYTSLADLGAFTAIGCTDGGAVGRAELEAMSGVLQEVAGEFGAASLVSALPCEYWPVATGTRPVGPVVAPKAPPILVVGNRGDNATPYEWAVSVTGQLESGVLVSYDGSQHGSYGTSSCVRGMVDEYLVNLVVPPADVDCPAGS